MKEPTVYITASKKNGTLYIGVTSNLPQRIYQHRSGLIDGFSKKYKCTHLVYYQQFEKMHEAIMWEKQLKLKRRITKIELIENQNPDWQDLYEIITQ
jgi:predicted GIY-YIG superfamily endonuclease